MRFIARIVIAGIGLYILLSLGLIQIFMALLIQVGKVIIQIAGIHPTAAAIGILLVIVMSGKNLIREDKRTSRSKGGRR